MKTNIFSSFLCLCWRECCSGDCSRSSLCYVPLESCSPGQHHPGRMGMEEGWISQHPAPKVGTQASARS